MTEQSEQPQASDAILGGQNPAPTQGAILGGIEGLQKKLTNPDLALRMEALDQAWSYGSAGRICLEQALSDRSKTVRRRARWLLRQPEGTETLPPSEPLWDLTERLAGYPGYSGEHVMRFANRDVQEFQPGENVSNAPQSAYALIGDYDDDANAFDSRLNGLLDTLEPTSIEALVFGGPCIDASLPKNIVQKLVSLRDRLSNLNALFIGDTHYGENEISWIEQSDVSPILQAYPRLELLQIRGGTGLKFSAISTPAGMARHDYLKALIVETGGLSRETVQQIYAWDFPALEHLELWFGSDNYGGDCWEQDLAPILDGLKFPNLTYLGLRNSQFTNELMDRLVQSPLLAGLQVLDLSLGTLSDEGAAKLLECDEIRDLETLNVSESYLSGAMIDQLRSLGIQVIADEQREEDGDEDDDPMDRRYCVVAE
jgi:hypothetical protein